MTIYLADSRSALGKRLWEEHGFGRMVVDRTPHPHPEEPWALDNGAFRDWRQGRIGQFARFERRLERIRLRMRLGTLSPPAFVVAPDLPGRGDTSLDYSAAWLGNRGPEPQCGAPPLRWYLATQDGMTRGAALTALPLFQGIFLGGSDAHKENAHPWAGMAHTAGLPIHYGRASTPAHVQRARSIGAQSLDTSWPLMGPRHLQEFLRALG